MAIYGSLGEVNIGALSATIADTAVDVFVYDTRKDSDGGAWRKRIQHTSWYNETLNTATRGSRRDFPAVAIIVATANELIIYDGDDPDMTMWMIFLRSGVGDNRYLTNARTNTAVFALNGQIALSDTVDCNVIKFISDTEDLYGSGGLYSPNANIGNRNNTSAVKFTITDSSKVIFSGSCNDIVMTVLPNAPIDSATGLPTPTIAVAGVGGVSIIKDDGTVINWLTTVGYVNRISISKNYELFADGGDTVAYYAWYNKTIPLVSNNISDAIFGTSYSSTSLPRLGSNGNSHLSKNVFTNDSISFFESAGISTNDKLILLNQNTSHFGNSLVSYITTSYNTGWMHGDIKGAWLSDTSTASITGTELITNGTFATDVTGWTANTSTNTWSSGVMQITRTGGAGQTTYQSFTTVAGQRYVATATVNSSGSRGDLNIINGTGWAGTVLGSASGTLGQTLQLTVDFTATSTTTTLGFLIDSITTSITVDNVSVRLAESDRSVTNKGLAVYGTLTKSVVATNADLVAYSGWNNSNYLLRPSGVTDLNNSSMTFMTWYKCGTYANEEAVISTGDYNNANKVRALYITGSGVPGFSGWGNDYNPSGISVRDNLWHHLAFTLQYISGTTYVVSIYVDGRFVGSSPRTLTTFTNTAIDIGGGTVYAIPAPRYAGGSLALARVSASVVSPSQMQKIYNDEKMLFQDNSKATIYGSSNTLTDLAYDDTTKLLHVGTSSGRSDFQGLERINNTTTAVTTAISASNGLIAEQ